MYFFQIRLRLKVDNKKKCKIIEFIDLIKKRLAIKSDTQKDLNEIILFHFILYLAFHWRHIISFIFLFWNVFLYQFYPRDHFTEFVSSESCYEMTEVQRNASYTEEKKGFYVIYTLQITELFDNRRQKSVKCWQKQNLSFFVLKFY